MHPENSNFHYRKLVQAACIAVFGLGVIYAVVTVLGLLSLPAPDEQIADPYFTLMEVLPCRLKADQSWQNFDTTLPGLMNLKQTLHSRVLYFL